MFAHTNPQKLTTNAVEIDARLGARLTRWEWFALAFILGMVGIFTWVHAQSHSLPFDYHNYIKAGQGDLLQHYYADWVLPLYWLLARVPLLLGYTIWNVAGVLCVFFAARAFGGNAALTLVTYQMLYVLFLGQITGILIGGLALCWWGMGHKRWNIAGLGLLIASTKFQIGIPFGLLLLLATDISWWQRFRVLLVPGMIVVVSLLIHPSWPLDLIARIQSYPPCDWASISLWRWLGPASLLLWLPPLLLPLNREKRFLALVASWPLTLPYYQQADLLALFVLPVGWLPLALGNLGYLFPRFSYDILKLLWLVPLAAYLSILFPAGYGQFRRFRLCRRSGQEG